MEVLQGNQGAPGRDRRATDQAPDGRRALDWGVRPSDVLLFPHSPLALADVLAHPAGRFDLMAVPPASSRAADDLARENALAGEAPGERPVISLQQRRRRRHPRERVNLLTRHGEEELIERCRQLLVENALVKRPGERQLFLAAGFLRWTDPADDESRRAPLLLYPVLLARIADERRYELRLDGSEPLPNAALAEALESRHALELPAPAPEEPLADHLGRVAALLSGHSGLELEFDIALGNAEMPRGAGPREEPVRLPPPPPGFEHALASVLVGTLALSELQTVLHLLPDYARADAAADAAEPNAAPADIGRLREYAARLSAEGLDAIEFRHLGALPASLARWRRAAGRGLATDSVATLVDDGAIGARHLVRLAGIIELIDKAPLVIEQYAHPDLCYRSTAAVLRRARHQARLIEDELRALQDWFVLDKVPAKRQLLSLIEELGGSVGAEPDIVDADYFNARRQFMEFSIEKPANLTPEHRRLLGQLAKVLRFRELFVNNTEYRAALGPGYRGLRTDWDALESMSDYAVELSEVLESEALAAAAIAAWPAFRRAFVTELETLQQAADATRRLLRVGGSRWQSRPVEELLAHSVGLGTRLAEWHAAYGTIASHARRTPAEVLSRFGDDERAALLTETRVADAQSRIEERLARSPEDGEDREDGEPIDPRERVVATLAWLREASAVAQEHELGVEAILARLELL